MIQHRVGDAYVVIDGERRTIRLTLGALAAIEEELGQGDIGAVAQRLQTLRVADLLVILRALLAGGGFPVTIEALKRADIDLGEAARAVAKAFSALAAGARQ